VLATGEHRRFARRRYACTDLPGTVPAWAYREQRLHGYTDRCLHGPAGNDAFVGRVRRQPPPDETSQSLNPLITTLRAPHGALSAGNRRASAICPAALRLHGPTRSSTCVGLSGTTLARVYRPVFARSCRKQRFCRSGQAPAATDETSTIAKPFDHHAWAPHGALITGNRRTSSICPAALRLHGPTGNNACTGLPERHLHDPAGNDTFVGRVRRQPPPDTGASRTAAVVKWVYKSAAG
jgi:hypothetical protein